MSEITIEALKEDLYESWVNCYEVYATLYSLPHADSLRTRLWSWLMDDNHTCCGNAAVLDGQVIGFALYREVPYTLTGEHYGYLDDLFVSAEFRSKGLGNSLIESVRKEGLRKGWSFVRWIALENNTQARTLYRKVAIERPFVTYQLQVNS